jgi:hypothetical protein
MTWRKGNRLRLVPESQAEGRVAEIFSEMKHVLGIPCVDGTYQALAAYPKFLSLHWQALRPIVETAEFFALAERMRADCYTRMHGYFEIPDLYTHISNLGFSTRAREELANAVELYNYSLPLLLLMIAAQLQAFDSPVGQKGAGTHPPTHPVFEEKLVTVPEQGAPAHIVRCYEEVKRAVSLPFVPDFYLSIARWPDFLREFWDTLKPILTSPVFEGCHYGERETAFALVREFPVPLELDIEQLADAGMGDEDIGSIIHILESFVDALSAMLLQIAAAKIALEGGTRASAPAQKAEPRGAKKGHEEAA